LSAETLGKWVFHAKWHSPSGFWAGFLGAFNGAKCLILKGGGPGAKNGGALATSAAAPDVCNGLSIPTKVPAKRPHRKPLKNRQNYARFRWLFGPENAISVKF
jgi:hypothetical protein